MYFKRYGIGVRYGAYSRHNIEIMYKLTSYPATKHAYFLVCMLLGVFCGPLAQAQSAAPAANVNLPLGASTKKVDEFLATLRPPTSYKALLSGNDLLLQVPDIARAGAVKARAVSTIARTDGMWLLSMHAMPDSGSPLFVGLQFDVSSLPEASLVLQLYKTQPVLLVTRAAGKYYGLYREVKVGQAASPGMSK